jgi:hypothetical protein
VVEEASEDEEQSPSDADETAAAPLATAIPLQEALQAAAPAVAPSAAIPEFESDLQVCQPEPAGHDVGPDHGLNAA